MASSNLFTLVTEGSQSKLTCFQHANGLAYTTDHVWCSFLFQNKNYNPKNFNLLSFGVQSGSLIMMLFMQIRSKCDNTLTLIIKR